MDLFEGEKISIDKKTKIDANKTDSEINSKYERGITRIVTEQARFHIESISSMVGSDAYKLDPEYQRRHRWSIERKSALIESLLMNVPIPPIFLYEYEFSKYEVMDGLQRLTSIAGFYNDDYPLESLTEWPELNGKKYSQLPEQIKAGIDRRYLSAIILLKETAKDSEEAERLKQMVFERINTGGETLEPQERRNANYGGRLNRLCIKLSEDERLCKLWEIPFVNDEPARSENKMFKKMADVELVLRFFAYRQRSALQKSSLEKYLDLYLKKGNLFNENVLNSLEHLFRETIAFADELLGERSFYIYRKKSRKNEDSWAWHERPNIVVYDPMMLALSQCLDDKTKILDHKSDIASDLEQFYQTNSDIFEGRNTNPTALIQRDEVFLKFIKSYI